MASPSHHVAPRIAPGIGSSEGYFPLGGIFRAERHFPLFKDQLAESGRQKTKENIIPRGKFRPVENDPNIVLVFTSDISCFFFSFVQLFY